MPQVNLISPMDMLQGSANLQKIAGQNINEEFGYDAIKKTFMAFGRTMRLKILNL
jgi:hypothetical protein